MAIRTANNQSLTEITALPSVITTGSLVLLATETASSSDLVTFDSNIDSTYKEYLFKYIDIHPGTDSVVFQVNFRDGSTAYDATKTSTFFSTYQAEADTAAALGYSGSHDLDQGTGVQSLSVSVGNDNDQCCSGYLHLFIPSSTTFVKHFMAVTNITEASNFTENSYIAGYCNTTSAIDGVQFMASAMSESMHSTFQI